MEENSGKPLKWFHTVVSAALAAAVVYFFGFRYNGHLRYCELCQLFEFTVAYATDVMSAPGGVSDYIGRFLTQFYLYPAAGACINALLILGVLGSFYISSRKKGPVCFIICSIPALFVWLFLLSENSLTGGVVALIIALSSGSSVNSIRNERVRITLEWILVPVTYMICGPLAIVSVLIAARQEKIWVTGISLIIAASLPVISGHIFECPAANLWAGVHYCRYRSILPVWLWAAAGCVFMEPVLYRLDTSGISQKSQIIQAAAGFLCLTAVSWLAVSHKANSSREETMQYSFMMLEGDWNGIIRKADSATPKSYTSVKCLNLALGMTGQLGDRMFHYPQEGPDCLLPDVSTDMISQITTAEVYRCLGMVNTSIHFTFEAQEGIPDFQKSGFCYRMLSEENAAGGRYEIASKYAEALNHTLFYKGTAELITERNMTSQPEMSYQFFNHSRIKSILGIFYAASRGENRLVLDYLMAYTLLEKDLDFFNRYLPLAGDSYQPQSWTEASLLYRSLSGEKVKELENFRKGPASIYSDTYWSYYFFRYNQEEEGI